MNETLLPGLLGDIICNLHYLQNKRKLLCFVYLISTAYSLIFLTLEYSRNLKVRNLGLEQLASLQQASMQRRGRSRWCDDV